MQANLPPDSPCPRLCHLIKWPDFNGYGFNLHAEKSKQGQYIGKVDEDSPALLAGLREGDKIIEVNNVNICNENHRQVVERIKSITNETRLLVIDDYGDRWYRERKIVIKSSHPNVIYYRTPVPRPQPGTLPIPMASEQYSSTNQRSTNKTNSNNNGSIKSSNSPSSLSSSPSPSSSSSSPSYSVSEKRLICYLILFCSIILFIMVSKASLWVFIREFFFFKTYFSSSYWFVSLKIDFSFYLRISSCCRCACLYRYR